MEQGEDRCRQQEYKQMRSQDAQNSALEAERQLDETGRQGFEALAGEDLNRPLYDAIRSFPLDAERDEYCGHCAEALQRHLAELGFNDFHQHAHGHSFVANAEYVVDVWPNNQPKVWRKTEPALRGSAYATFVDEDSSQHTCWCSDTDFGPHEHIGTPARKLRP
jgi:hypothetical protein